MTTQNQNPNQSQNPKDKQNIIAFLNAVHTQPSPGGLTLGNLRGIQPLRG